MKDWGRLLTDLGVAILLFPWLTAYLLVQAIPGSLRFLASQRKRRFTPHD